MLLVLVKMKRLLDLITKALARGFAVSTMLLLVNIASTTTLGLRQSSFGVKQCRQPTPVWNSS